MKKISVIVPCYNAAAYLDRCMEHLLEQTIGTEEIEIILVDDASTDDGATQQKIIDYEQRFPDVITAIFLEQNLRQGGARNVGMSYAHGEYLMFCDADDWLAYRAMEILYGTAKAYDADVVEYRYKTVTDTRESGEIIEQGNGSYYREMDLEDVKRKLLMGSTDDFSLGCMRKLYRTSLICDHSICFAEKLICEEPSFTLPVRLYEKKHVYVDAALYYYLLQPDSTMHSNWDLRKWDNIKVWMLLMEDMGRRGFLAVYSKELECMMYDWGFGLSIRMILQKGYVLTLEELQMLKKVLLGIFPHILDNPYVAAKDTEWDSVLQYILRTELTDRIVGQMNAELTKALRT